MDAPGPIPPVTTIADLLTRERRSPDRALRTPGHSGAEYSYHDLVTTASKTGNYFRRCGVHEGSTVAVADDPGGPAILAFLGAALNGAVTRFDPPADGELDATVLVAPGESIHDYELVPGGQRVAYGDVPEDPHVAAMGRDVWSENPAFPEPVTDPGRPALVSEAAVWSHATLLDGGRRALEILDLASHTELAIRAPLALPGTVTAGVVAPLLVGATMVIPDEESVADVAVGTGFVPEPAGISPAPADDP